MGYEVGMITGWICYEIGDEIGRKGNEYESSMDGEGIRMVGVTLEAEEKIFIDTDSYN